MATLEKIRNKSVLLIVVIGVALIAFIVGDFFTSGRQVFGSATTVAKVGGSKIDINEFQKRYNEQSQMLAQNQNNDGAVLQQDILDEMINEKLLDNEFDDLGIDVTASELSDFMVGKHAIPDVMQFAQSMGVQSPAQLHDMLFNPAKYSINEQQVLPMRQKWMELEKQTEAALKRQKLAMLVMGGIQANDLDILEMQNENQIYQVQMVKKNFASLNDAEFPVTDDEIKALYEKEKGKYKTIEEIRKVLYIAVNVVPSAQDEAAAKVLMDTTVNALRNNPGIDNVRSNSDLTINERTIPYAKAEAQIQSFIANAEIGSVSNVTRNGNAITVTKLIGKKMESDSVKINMVGIEGPKTLQDSVLKMLNSGVSLAEVAKIKGVQGTQADQWVDLTAIGSQDADAKDKVLNAGTQYFVIQSNDQFASICQVAEKKAPKQMYELADVSYTLYPSETTKQNLLDKLETFVNKNNTPATFKKNAVPAGYQVVETYITQDMPRLAVIPNSNTADMYGRRVFNIRQTESIPNSRGTVLWAFGAEEGKVSHVFDKDNNDKYVALAVEEIVPKGYIPVTDPQLRADLTKQIRNDKKAAKLIASYKGKASDLKGYAVAMGAPVDSVSASFSNGLISMVGIDQTAVGTIAGSQPGKLVGPTQGDLGVYVFQTAPATNAGPVLSKEEAANRFNAIFGGRAVIQGVFQILREKNPVTNNLSKFFNNANNQ